LVFFFLLEIFAVFPSLKKRQDTEQVYESDDDV
jgi:hypothetical protein